MNDDEVKKYWDDNAIAWTALARAGFDVYRDQLNTPAFFEILPSVENLAGIDIGCGEGHNTRLLARKAASVKAVDISENFIQKAKEFQNETQPDIEYFVASAANLPFENESFDFAVSFMCLMDVPDLNKALAEAFRVLKPDGFLQFSIAHPCFSTPHRKNIRELLSRKVYAVEVGEYFKNYNGKIDEWIFGAAPAELKNKYSKFKIPVFYRTLSQWFTAILGSGFVIEQINEPYPGDEVVSKYPSLQDAQIVSYFLHIRCRKPAKKQE